MPRWTGTVRWLTYNFNNCWPFQFTQVIGPAEQNTHVEVHSIYAQEQWTMNRLTLSGALRWDHTAGSFPEQTIGPNPFVPAQIVVPAQKGTQYDDLTPRGAVGYDLFGNGKTAVKFNIGKYLAAADGSSITGGTTNPLGNFVTSSGSRTWTDQHCVLAPCPTETEALVAPHRERGGLRAEMSTRGAKRIGGLRRMAPLTAW